MNYLHLNGLPIEIVDTLNRFFDQPPLRGVVQRDGGYIFRSFSVDFEALQGVLDLTQGFIAQLHSLKTGKRIRESEERIEALEKGYKDSQKIRQKIREELQQVNSALEIKTKALEMARKEVQVLEENNQTLKKELMEIATNL